jgi:hypothetical protein
MIAKRLFALIMAVPVLVALVYCGGSDSTPPTSPTPAPTVAPTSNPPPVTPLSCDPTPPPLNRIRVNVHQNIGFRKTLDSTPFVDNVDGYCERTGQDGDFCLTRLEGDPQRQDCDRMAVGMAGDTLRYGPTWFFNGEPCKDLESGEEGCSNHPDNQFLVIAKGTGEVAACASEEVSVDGSRVCGGCRINPNNSRCDN